MSMQAKYTRTTVLVVFAGAVVALGLFLPLLSGCASNDAAGTAHQIHSMTPCGMMMDAMMGGAHASAQSSETATGEEIPPVAYPSTEEGHNH